MIQLPSSVPLAVPPGARIYKDDCMFSFDTSENNPNGLDVCLHCYQGFASRPDKDYTVEHVAATGHAYYLNIIKTLKPQTERLPYNEVDGEKQPKIAKLEVKDVTDEDIYDTAYTVRNAQNNEGPYLLDELSPEFRSVVDTVIAGNSSGKEDEIAAWEQQIFPCEHTIELEQFENDSIDLSKCGECELSENLWICLHCGHLGCGRLQYGSELKGNGHALEHYALSEHPVAVKLGSLSADDEDKADVYCYKCNDEVKVADLAKKLLKYGINISNAVKTEKSLVELNLDQNMNWQFQLDDVNGEKLQPVFGPGLTGMKNMGNSCYLNTVVQTLFSLDSYKDYFKDKQFPSGDPSKSLLSQFVKIYDGLESGRYSKPSELKGDAYQLGIKPSTFSKLVGENHPEFKTQKQQDAYEFLLYLLDKMDNEFGYEATKDSKFLLFNKTVCTNCDNVNVKPELVDNLSIPIEDKATGVDDDNNTIYEPVDLLDSLSEFCEAEPIEGFQCDNCNTVSVALKSTCFRTLPKSLIINTQRIKLKNWVPVKVNVPINFSEPLDLKHLIVDGDDANDNVILEAAPKEDTFEPNAGALEMLMATGFPENRCIKALYITGNSSAEDAMNWLIEHMEDADIDEPLQLGSTKSAQKIAVNEQDVETLMAMGFEPDIAAVALRKNGNDVSRAIEWIYDNPGANPNDEEEEDQSSKNTIDIAQQKRILTEKLLESPVPPNTSYVVKAIICHKGSSPHTGHYVVFIRKNIDGEDKWVLFNDEKVVVYPDISSSEVSNNGYIYVLQRQDQ